jgi:lysyl-tRNA synthetase, class I
LAKLTKIKGIYEYINKLNPPSHPDTHIPYRFIAQQASIFPPDDDGDRSEKVFNRLIKYGMVREEKKKSERIMNKIRLASNWGDDNTTTNDEKFEIRLSNVQRKAVQELIESIRPFAGLPDSSDNAKNLQSNIFSIARANGIEPKEFFALLYRMFLNTDRGPRIGNYLLDLGINRATSQLKRYLNN